MSFEKARPIWHRKEYTENDFAEFYDVVNYTGGSACFRVSVAGDYTLFVNGKFAASNQYGDFPHYKVYDEIDITPFLKNGENTICILGWYFGKSGMRYFTPSPMLIYELKIDGEAVLCSSEKTLSRKSKAYKSGFERKISAQFGYSFLYDAAKEDDWLLGGQADFAPSMEIKGEYNFTKRPTKKLSLGDCITGEIIKTDNSYIIDLGREIVGLPTFSVVSETEQKINIAYGELLEAGHVKRFIGERDFSFDYAAKAGENEFTSYMLRFAARYIEITAEEPVSIKFAGIIPQFYPTEEKEIQLENELDQKIYDVCINTLKLCMMEHYVDCPWREQCLYAFDSRNQMLSGYAAFSDGNLDYARANLLLMSKDRREDGLLSICFPSGEDLTIPSFSLYFILAVCEYMEKSGDNTLGEEVFEKIESILTVFKNQMKNGLACRFEGFGYWNFYDWSHLGYIRRGQGKKEPDFLLNAIFVIGLNAYAKICEKLGKTNSFSGLSEEISKRLNKDYFNGDTGTYFIQEKTEKPTELANALAIFAGVATGDGADAICEKLAKGQLETCSLSMKVFKYDALIKVDKEKYKDCILDEIRKTYKVMLDAGSSTVWETIEGATAFENAGSLCHGWSAVPVHYYRLFLEQIMLDVLFENQDLEYKAFNQKLIPNIDPDTIIGIRTPVLRKIAKDFSGTAEREEFLKRLPHKYYEENNLHAFFIEQIKDFDRCIAEINRFLPYVDNWGTCDSMRPKCFAKNKDKLFLEIEKWLKSKDTYSVRFGIGMLMVHFLDADFDKKYLEMIASVKSDEYYINMMIAWYFATALAKKWDETYPYIKDKKLPRWVHNKTIQKAIESYRIKDEQKAILKGLKIKEI